MSYTALRTVTALVIGASGAGKSTFVNHVLDLKDGDAGYCEVGYGQTSETTIFKPVAGSYSDPNYVLTLVDSPGFPDDTGGRNSEFSVVFKRAVEVHKPQFIILVLRDTGRMKSDTDPKLKARLQCLNEVLAYVPPKQLLVVLATGKAPPHTTGDRQKYQKWSKEKEGYIEDFFKTGGFGGRKLVNSLPFPLFSPPDYASVDSKHLREFILERQLNNSLQPLGPKDVRSYDEILAVYQDAKSRLDTYDKARAQLEAELREAQQDFKESDDAFEASRTIDRQLAAGAIVGGAGTVGAALVDPSGLSALALVGSAIMSLYCSARKLYRDGNATLLILSRQRSAAEARVKTAEINLQAFNKNGITDEYRQQCENAYRAARAGLEAGK